MKASILKRLEQLEALAELQAAPQLSLVLIHALPDSIRDAYWNAEDTNDRLVQNQIIEVATGRPAPNYSRIHTVVVSLTSGARDDWRAERELDDTTLEARQDEQLRAEEAADRERLRQQADAKQELIRAPRKRSVWGYDRFGAPIYDDDTRLKVIAENRS